MRKFKDTKIRFRNSDFSVSKEINRSIYSLKGCDSDDTLRHAEDPVINFFVLNRERFLTQELVNFLDLAGIDWRKENEVYHYPINQLIAIEGWYDIVGTMNEEERVDGIVHEGDFFTTNIFFENNIRIGQEPEFKDYLTFRIDFTILIPKEFMLITTQPNQ